MSETEEFKESPIIRDKKTALPLWTDQRPFQLRYYIPVKRIEEFFRGLEEGKILATQCKSCGQIFFPPQMDCPKCKSSDMKWIQLSDEAELVTYTIIRVKPKTFEHYNDYVIAVGRLLKEKINVFAWLKVDDPSKIRIGMKLKLIVTKREPENYLVYEFIPMKNNKS
ncbi:MAG: Zn-ribbon domain-containing OB-fold protein [Candidatus Njordarchaeales archaeon]